MRPDGAFEDARPAVPALEGHMDRQFRAYNLDHPDMKRAERFISKLKRVEQQGEMPRLQIMRPPNDHTYDTRVGKPTPTTMVADNDMLRTMELILGLKPMSQFDAAARPMYHSITATPDFTPYAHESPKADRNAKNEPTAWGVDLSEKFNLATEDLADDIVFNVVIWRSVKGSPSRMPAPDRAEVFVPVKPKRRTRMMTTIDESATLSHAESRGRRAQAFVVGGDYVPRD